MSKHCTRRSLYKKVFLVFLISFIIANHVYAQWEEYSVKEGDNLWLISEKFFNDPYKWLDLWKLNSSIKDPHWIYPGQVIKMPIKKQKGSATKEFLEEKKEEQEAKEEQGKKVEELVIYESKPQEVEVAKEEPKPKIKKYILEVRNIERLPIFSESPIKDYFTILSSEDKRRLGAKNNRFFINGGEIQGLKKGEKLLIIKPFKELRDEQQKKVFGYLYEKKGVAVISEVYPQTTEIKIVKSYAEVEPGDMVIFHEEMDNPEVVIKKAKTFLEGKILDLHDSSNFVGERSFVFLDKGEKDGLERGDIVKIEKRLDGVKDTNIDIGRLVVVKVWENFSAGYVIEIKDVATKGDRFSTYIEGY